MQCLPIYAISPALWRETKKLGVQSVPEHLPGACEWELWHFDPAIVPNSDTVPQVEAEGS